MSSTVYQPWGVTAGEQPTTAYWNILGSNDSSFNTGQGFNDGIIINRHLGLGAALSANVKPTYIQSTGNNNGTGSRSTSSSNFQVPGTSISYTSGSTNEVIQIWGFGLCIGASAGVGLQITSGGSGISRRTYSDTTVYTCHYPQTLFLASPNTSYTFGLLLLASGSSNICNSNTDPAAGFQPNLEMLVWGRT